MSSSTKTKTDDLIKETRDWQDSKIVGIKFSPSTGLYYCEQHKLVTKLNNIKNHLKTHNKNENVSDSVEDTLQTLKDQLETQSDTRVPTPAEMILEDHNREIAEAAGMLAKDYELRAQYEIMQLEKKIPWDWSFYDWLKATVTFWNKAWGYRLELPQDLAVLDTIQKEWLRDTMQENIAHEIEPEEKIEN